MQLLKEVTKTHGLFSASYPPGSKMAADPPAWQPHFGQKEGDPQEEGAVSIIIGKQNFPRCLLQTFAPVELARTEWHDQLRKMELWGWEYLHKARFYHKVEAVGKKEEKIEVCWETSSIYQEMDRIYTGEDE